MTIKIIVNGAFGRMGQLATNMIENNHNFCLVAKLGKNDDLARITQDSKADIVIDFTIASVAFENAQKIIQAGAHPVIGTTGFSSEQIASLQTLCRQKKLGGIIAPNFSIGAVLLMKYAKDVVQYFPDVEIIEMHHDGKQDSPSGTALKTAAMIAEQRKQLPSPKQEKEIIPHARGAVSENIHIHAIRLPGLVAHEQVIFGGHGETLTIRHDTIHRECFMPGLKLACEKVMGLQELVYGLEYLL